MKKIAIILDSFSGLSKTEVENKGYFFLPQLLIANGETFNVGDNIQLEDMTEILNSGTKTETSQPNLGALIDMYDELSPKYDDVIFISMHSKLSSTYSTAVAQAANYKNVRVIENKICGSGIVRAADEAVKVYAETQDVNKVEEYIKDYSKRTASFVLPANIERLISSGRLTGAKKYVLKIGKLVPALYVSDSGFKVDTLKRTLRRLITHSVEQAMKKLSITSKNIDQWVFEAHSSLDGDIRTMAKNAFKGVGAKNTLVTNVTPAVASHVGKGLGILVYPVK